MPAPAEEIWVYNRGSRRIETEQVYGRRWMDVFYGKPWGRRITAALLCKHPLSRLYGWLQKSAWSRRKISAFTAQYRVDLSEAVIPADGFASFNDFFIRRLKPAARPIAHDPRMLISPADSRVQAFQIDNDTPLSIKGAYMTVPQLLGMQSLAPSFKGGICLIFRLAPSDFHRFGYMEDGIQEPVHIICGPLHSVSPLSLRHKPDIHCTNYRHWCLIHTTRLGAMLQVEVGAMLVGSIVQFRPDGGPCRRGEEKGYFQFGGSTVIAVLEPGRVRIDDDILEYSGRGIETLVHFGERVATVATA
ncbi:MAG: phosphatidylserine decarboxylase [Desulfobacteraceae bacterium]|nr:MAG: phosphatidylserine decarboxylase [Desulfobacteraceae bacterium]